MSAREASRKRKGGRPGCDGVESWEIEDLKIGLNKQNKSKFNSIEIHISHQMVKSILKAERRSTAIDFSHPLSQSIDLSTNILNIKTKIWKQHSTITQTTASKWRKDWDWNTLRSNLNGEGASFYALLQFHPTYDPLQAPCHPLGSPQDRGQQPWVWVVIRI